MHPQNERHFGENLIKCFLEGPYKGDDQLQILELMIEKSSEMNPYSQKKYGFTALHWLCRYYNRESLTGMVRSLIEKPGVDVNAKDSKGKTAFLELCQASFILENPEECVKVV